MISPFAKRCLHYSRIAEFPADMTTSHLFFGMKQKMKKETKFRQFPNERDVLAKLKIHKKAENFHAKTRTIKINE